MTLRRIKNLLWFVLGAGLTAMALRLIMGLGAATELNHNVSWGIWNAVKISIVPLSAGGFVLAGIVHILHLERYRPVLRLAILTGFLGYSTFATMLIFDIGVPYRIWHPMVFWQHHSVLFEVAWCVMLYLTVLALEFAPNALEHPLFKHPLLQKVYSVLKKATVPLVMSGIVLSTLHQSSLGSLFLIVPHRLDPLWYSPLVYLLFFISALGMGLLVLSVEAFLIERYYRVEPPIELLASLARAGAVFMALFLLVRLADQFSRGILPGALGSSPMSPVFVIELLLASLVPLLLLSKRVSRSRGGLFACALSSVLGVVLYRSNVALLAIDWGPENYFPAWTEIALCAGILAGSALAFIFLIENLDIYGGPMDPVGLAPASRDEAPEPGLAFENWLAESRVTSVRRHSLLILVGATLALLVLHEEVVRGAKPSPHPVLAARSVRGLAIKLEDGLGRKFRLAEAAAKGLPLLLIDGNRDGEAVFFHHKGHVERNGGERSCGLCHHLSMPLDENTSCSECHGDMYEPVSLFSHESHVRELGGNGGCIECHADHEEVKTRATATACSECHSDSAAQSAFLPEPEERWKDAAGYMDAMHGLCVGCHEREIERHPARHARALGECAACHDTDRSGEIRRISRRARTSGREDGRDVQ
ncbi:NrfD/PsrC family molybdoenzyme membrane anchor subunit [Elusimicrobiota bacterium]